MIVAKRSIAFACVLWLAIASPAATSSASALRLVSDRNAAAAVTAGDGLGPCSNEAFRDGTRSATLPDCRAYEQVTPIDKNGGDAGGQLFKVQASNLGAGITSQTKAGLPGGEGSQTYPLYLSRRDHDGWLTRGVLPPPSYGANALVQGWTPDLQSFMLIAAGAGDGGGVLQDKALFVRSAGTNAIQAVTEYLPGAEYGFAGASDNDSKLFFELGGIDLNGDTPGNDNLYVFEPGNESLTLVGVLPDGTAPPGGSFAGPFNWNREEGSRLTSGGALGFPGGAPGADGYLTQELNAISADGSRAFFTAGDTGQLYLRDGIGGAPATVQISASQRTAPDPVGARPAIFMGATPSGSTAFFLSCQKLTDDATAHSTSDTDCQTAGQGQDLYAYDSESLELRDLTVDGGDPLGADVQGMIGASEDGSYVYFVANGDLDGPGGRAQQGDCQHQQPGGFHYTGTCSLYVWHAGSIGFVARLDPSGGPGSSDAANWMAGGVEYPPTGQVSADGQTIVFRSHLQLTGYDNEPVGGGECHNEGPACSELFRYHVGAAELGCLTCTPTGAPPVIGGSTLQSQEAGLADSARPIGIRFASAAGQRVFFETPEKLVGGDVNGDDGCPMLSRPLNPVPSCQDVYEWEAAGAGSCTAASPAFSDSIDGCLFLLSSGTTSDPSFFGDASLSGNHAFIFTSDRLVSSDEDRLFDIYDAGVEGGLLAQNQPPSPPACAGEACLAPDAGQPDSPVVGSASFHGPGNPAPRACPKGRVRRGASCVKPHRKRPRHTGKRHGGGRREGHR